MLHLTGDVNNILSQIQGEGSQELKEMMQKLDGLQDANVEEYIKKVSDFYNQLLYEEKVS